MSPRDLQEDDQLLIVGGLLFYSKSLVYADGFEGIRGCEIQRGIFTSLW